MLQPNDTANFALIIAFLFLRENFLAVDDLVEWHKRESILISSLHQLQMESFVSLKKHTNKNKCWIHICSWSKIQLQLQLQFPASWMLPCAASKYLDLHSFEEQSFPKLWLLKWQARVQVLARGFCDRATIRISADSQYHQQHFIWAQKTRERGTTEKHDSRSSPTPPPNKHNCRLF